MHAQSDVRLTANFLHRAHAATGAGMVYLRLFGSRFLLKAFLTRARITAVARVFALVGIARLHLAHAAALDEVSQRAFVES